MNAEDPIPQYDVIIVGAGPTGLTLANLLGQEGISVLAVERNSSTVQEPRAVSIDDESLRTMQAAGLVEEVMSQVVSGYGSRYLTASGKSFLTVMPRGSPYGYPRRNAFRQPILEQQLMKGLERFPLVNVQLGAIVTGFEQGDDLVETKIMQEGICWKARGRYLIGCDGASSSIRKSLGFKLEGETLPERWLIVDLEDSPAERDTVVFCDVDRPCIALPGPDLTRRFEFKLFDGEQDSDILQPEIVKTLLDSRGAARSSQIVRQTVYTFHARVADRWSERRVFLAGDAAHLTPPFAGQGMNSGIRDAHNLAWKLTEVIRGRLDESVLDTYEFERRDHVNGMIDLALRMGRIMGPPSRLRGWMTQTAFRIAGLWPPLRSYFGEMKYKPRPFFKRGFLVHSKHALVGRLLAQPLVKYRDGNPMLLDSALPKGFVLLGIDIALPEVKAAIRKLPTGKVMISPSSLMLSTAAPDFTSLLHLGPPETALSAASGALIFLRPDRYAMAAFLPGQIDAHAPAIVELFGSAGSLTG